MATTTIKKVANYFSSRRRKQLTTGIMCWLKSNPVSMKEKNNFFFFFYSVAWRLSTPQSMLTLTWSQLLFTYRRTEIWFVELIHHHWSNCSMRRLPYERSCLSCHFIKNILFLLKPKVKLRLTFPHKFSSYHFFLDSFYSSQPIQDSEISPIKIKTFHFIKNASN